MAGAWKTSDGGSIRCLGSSSVSGAHNASANLISAAVNTRGITLRTAFVAASGASGWGWLEVGGTPFVGASVGVWEMSAELFIPAGVSVDLVRNGGTINVGITYDIH